MEITLKENDIKDLLNLVEDNKEIKEEVIKLFQEIKDKE